MSFIIDAESKLDYGVDWAVWLGDTDLIATSTWTISPVDAGMPVLTAASNDSTETTVWVDNPTNGEEYMLTNHIVTVEGREHDCTIHLRCRPR